jgi:hypothetical protein
MSVKHDQMGISIVGIQSIMPMTRTTRLITKRKPKDDSDTGDAWTEPKHASPLTPGTGRLVDKAV